MSQPTKSSLPESDRLMKTVGALKEAKEELETEIKEDRSIDAEEVGSILGKFLKGLLSVLKL